VRDRGAPGRSEVRSPPRPRSGRDGAPSQERRPAPAGPRRSPPWVGRARVPCSKLVLPSAVRRGPSPRKVRVLRPVVAPARGRRAPAPAAGVRSPGQVPSAAGFRPVPRAPAPPVPRAEEPPVPRVPGPNDRPAVLLASSAGVRLAVRRGPSAGVRLAVRRGPSAADGRAVRRGPSAGVRLAVRRGPSAGVRLAVRRGPSAGVRLAVRRGPSAGVRLAVRRGPSDAAGRAVRRVPSPAEERLAVRVPASPRDAVRPCARSPGDVLVVRRGPSAAGVRGARRALSPVAPSRPVLPRPLRGSGPERPDAERPRLWLADPLVPAGRGLLPGFLAPWPVPEVARAVFGVPSPAPPLLRPPPLVPRPLGVPRPSATLTNLQHLPPQYPDKRRGPLNLIGSDPLQACPAASYSPTRSPAQYHRR
jgi:hypothetical protein